MYVKYSDPFLKQVFKGKKETLVYWDKHLEIQYDENIALYLYIHQIGLSKV